MRAKKYFVFPAFLIEKERIIFRVHPHWFYIFLPELILVIFAILFFKIGWPALAEINFPYWTVFIFGGVWVLAAILFFLEWICINYYLTNLRLIEERGIVGKRIMSIWLDKVQDITCKFGILGRILGFGDLEIESAGTYGKIVFSFLPKPKRLKEEIERAIFEFKK